MQCLILFIGNCSRMMKNQIKIMKKMMEAPSTIKPLKSKEILRIAPKMCNRIKLSPETVRILK